MMRLYRKGQWNSESWAIEMAKIVLTSRGGRETPLRTDSRYPEAIGLKADRLTFVTPLQRSS